MKMVRDYAPLSAFGKNCGITMKVSDRAPDYCFKEAYTCNSLMAFRTSQLHFKEIQVL